MDKVIKSEILRQQIKGVREGWVELPVEGRH
jgi:hypothetical protein